MLPTHEGPRSWKGGCTGCTRARHSGTLALADVAPACTADPATAGSVITFQELGDDGGVSEADGDFSLVFVFEQ